MEVKSEELQVYQTPATKSPSTPTKYTNKVYTPSTPTKYTKSPGSKYILKPPSTATKYTKLKHRSIPNSGHQVHQVPQIQAASIPNLANKYTKFSNQSPPKYTEPESTPNLATKYTKSSYKKYSKPKYTNHTKSSQKVCQISRFGWSHHKILNSFSTSFFFTSDFPGVFVFPLVWQEGPGPECASQFAGVTLTNLFWDEAVPKMALHHDCRAGLVKKKNELLGHLCPQRISF